MKKRLFVLLTCILLINAYPSYAYIFHYFSYLDDLNPTTEYQTTQYFLSQHHTGVYSSSNCGPTSLKIIFNWLNLDTPSIANLRNQLNPSPGYVYTDQIEAYLNTLSITYGVYLIETVDDLLDHLDEGILLVCADISKVSYASTPDTPIGKQFTEGTGHYFVITGYYKHYSNLYFQVLDPLNTGVRYYPDLEVLEAITSWHPYSYVFNKPSQCLVYDH